jgi:predicted nucleotidyltransferase
MSTAPADRTRAILDALELIEVERGVRVLMAVESGSRLWGIESLDSDYDVRFVYRRPIRDYLSLEAFEQPDTLTLFIDDDLDLHGWDVRKASRLALKSNPSLVEWVRSPIIYRATPFLPALEQAVRTHVDLDSIARAYFGMAHGNYTKYVLNRSPVPLKRLLYVLRPLLAVRWIHFERSLPPLRFTELFKYIDVFARAEALELLRLKRTNELASHSEPFPKLEAFIASSFSSPLLPPASQRLETPAAFDDIDKLLLRTRRMPW